MFKHKDKIIWWATSIAFTIGVIIFAFKGWDIAEPWTFILSVGIPLLLSGLYLFVFKKAPETVTPASQPTTNNTSSTTTTNSLTMTYEQIKDLINNGDYVTTFEELDKVRDQMPNHLKNPYAQLKATFVQEKHGVDYPQQLTVFVGQLKSILMTDNNNDKAADNSSASNNGGGRVINTTNYFENTGTVNLDQRNTPKDDE